MQFFSVILITVSWAPACLVWSRLNKHLAPFLQWTLTGGVLGVQWRDNMLRQAVATRYQKHAKWANQMIYDYYIVSFAYFAVCCLKIVFQGKWWAAKSVNVIGRLCSQDTIIGNCYNRRKLDELPFHYYQLKGDIENSPYLTDINWLYEKVCGSNCYQILEDINMQKNIRHEYTISLRNFIETHASILNYDGRQFYSHLYKYLDEKMKRKELNDSTLKRVYKLAKDPPVSSYVLTNNVQFIPEDTATETFHAKNYDLVVRLPETNRFIVSVSTNKEEVCVWDVKK